MKRYALFALVAITALSSCMKETLSLQETGLNDGCFTARFDAPVKTTLQGLDVVWNPGDEILINGYVYRTDEGGLTASFAPEGEKAPVADKYIAVYPATLSLDDDAVCGSLPDLQQAVPGSFPEESHHAAAMSTESLLQFKSMFSYLAVTVKVAGVRSITVSANGGESICGPYSATFSGGVPEVCAKGDVSHVQLSAGAGTDTFAVGEEYLIAVFPTNLSEGFTISFEFDEEHGGGSWSKATDRNISFARAAILDLGAFNGDSLEMESNASVSIDLASALSSEVSPMLFGSFSEMHSADLVPGILEQYVLNPSMEDWYRNSEQEKSDLVFTDIVETAGVAYPWEVRAISGSPSYSKATDSFNTDYSQKISLPSGSSASLYQRLALPTYRVDSYKVRFYAKRTGSASLSVHFSDVSNNFKSGEFTPGGLSSDWQCFEHEFVLDAPSSLRYGRYGIYNLCLDASGEGDVLIDAVTLFPSDCVEGMFNPETLQYFKDYKVASLRWPGGNFTTTYHWKDGIGDPDKRPTRPNYAWNGVDANQLGTDEFMRFCSLAGCTPVMGVGFGNSTVEEVADWVEYCNGPTGTPMGALRAANGHPEPYNVRFWGFGNEVYYHYSVGEYATTLSEVSMAMKAVDPGITVIASGFGVHNSYRDPYASWTQTLQTTAGQDFDLIDTHYYVYGPPQASDTQSFTAGQLFRIFSAANLYLKDFVDRWRSVGAGKGLAMTEFGVLPKSSDRNTPRRQAFTNLLCTACEYNEMVRQSDIVKLVNAHNFSFYVNPQSNHSEPVNARTALFREYSEMAGGHALQVDASGVPSYAVTDNFLDIGLRASVPELDVAAVRKGNFLYVSVVNRNVEQEYCLGLNLSGGVSAASSGEVLTCSSPYAVCTWTSDSGVVPAVSPAKFAVSSGICPKVLVPPLSFSMLKIRLD